MIINYYECQQCGFRIDVGIYSRLIAGTDKCFSNRCDENPRDYKFVKAGDKSPYWSKVAKENPEGFTMHIEQSGVTIDVVCRET